MVKFGVEVFWVVMGERVLCAKVVAYVHPQGDFDAFQRVQGKQAQLFVEDVELQDMFKADFRREGIAVAGGIICFFLPQGVCVTAQAVITDALQIVQCPLFVFNAQSA